MKEEFNYLNLLAVVVAAMIAGMLINRLTTIEPAFAASGGMSVVKAGEFRLVDSEGTTRLRMFFPQTGKKPSSVLENPTVDFLDADGRIRLSLGLEYPMGRPCIKLNNSGGDETLYLGFDELESDSPGLYFYKKYRMEHHPHYSGRKRVLLPIEVIWPRD